MNSNEFYKELRKSLVRNQVIGRSRQGNSYFFVEWRSDGALVFVTSGQKKILPLEVIYMSCFLHSKGLKVDIKWLKTNGVDVWCIPPILTWLLKEYKKIENQV